MQRDRREAPDCRRRLEPIRVIDRGAHGTMQDFEYAADDDRKSFWTGGYPIAGRLEAWLCPGCGRVLLYAEPSES